MAGGGPGCNILAARPVRARATATARRNPLPEQLPRTGIALKVVHQLRGLYSPVSLKPFSATTGAADLPLNIPTWIATKFLEMIGSALWGFKPNLMRHIVEQHGALRSLGWFVRNMPSYERTLQQWGPIPMPIG